MLLNGSTIKSPDTAFAHALGMGAAVGEVDEENDIVDDVHYGI